MSEVTDTRSLILHSAIDLFVAHKYEGVSIRQIAEASKCNIGSISYHFGGKEKLYEACFDSLDTKDFYQALADLDEAHDSSKFDDKIKSFIYKIGKFAIQNRKILCLYVMESYSPIPRIKDIQDRLKKPAFESISYFFQEAMDKKIVRPDLNISFLARTLMTIVQTEFIFKSATNEDAKIISEEFIKLCNRSIYEL